MTGVTFIHAADLHLDSPFVGLKHIPQSLLTRVQESTFISFQKIINLAIQKQVDFIILAGDLYDAEQRSLKAQIRFRNEMLRLEQEGIHAYIIHGNHDPLNGNWVELEWPSNVHFFSGSIGSIPFVKNEQHVANLYGFSYPQKEVSENMASLYRKEPGPRFHIGILHGTVSSNQDHVPYAPFQINDLMNKDFDYWALGHIHQRQILKDSPPIVYPGNIQGRHRKETGDKGCYLARLDEGGSDLTFFETCDVLWENVIISIDQIHTIDGLISQCVQQLDPLRKPAKGVMVHIILTGCSELSSILQDHDIVEDLIFSLQEGEGEQEDFVYVCSLDNQTQLVENLDRLKKEQHFLGDLLHQIEQYERFDEALAPLYSHRKGRKYISSLSHEEKDLLLKEAESWILNELLKVSK